MTPLRERPEWSQLPVLLSDPQMDRPYQVFEEFFADFNLSEIRQALQQKLVTCLTTENTAYGKAEQRAGLLQHHDRLVELVEAAFLIVWQKRASGVFIAS